VKEIGPGVFQLESTGRTVNIFFVQADVPVLVDTGTARQGRAVVEELRSAGMTPELVVLTHGDFDHCGAADEIAHATGARVCAPAAERALLTGAEKRRLFVRFLIRTVNRGRGPRLPSIDRWLEPGEGIAGLETIPTPGHTPGHTAYRLGTTLFAGDAVITGEPFREPVEMFCIDPEEARRSIEKLATLEVDLVASGHGRPSRDGQANLAGLAETWSSVRR
jgi:glyoxylase-like metal-dependent hydrolase (beta-lactamase superfamily II)